MRLTRAGEYAVRCALYLAYQGEGVTTSRREIARVMDIPNQFLSKIAPQLAKAQIIEIIQGAKGGYRLIISPDKLTMLDVVEAVIGEIFLNDCVIRPETCQRAPACSAHQVWEKARNQLRNTLRQTSFKQMLEVESCSSEELKRPR